MLNLIMKNAQKKYFWWIGNRTAPNKRALIYFFSQRLTQIMHQEGFELRRSHKQNEVGGLLLPLLQLSIFIDLEKPPDGSSAAINIWLSQPTTNTAGVLSLKPEVLCRRQIMLSDHTSMQTLPKATTGIMSGTNAVAYYKQHFCTWEYF